MVGKCVKVMTEYSNCLFVLFGCFKIILNNWGKHTLDTSISHFTSTVISSFRIVINDIGFSIDQKDVGPIDLHAFKRK